MKFKKGEFVLINDGGDTYKVAKIVNPPIYNEGHWFYGIGFGAYAVNYREDTLHKCPRTISKIITDRKKS